MGRLVQEKYFEVWLFLLFDENPGWGPRNSLKALNKQTEAYGVCLKHMTRYEAEPDKRSVLGECTAT